MGKFNLQYRFLKCTLYKICPSNQSLIYSIQILEKSMKEMYSLLINTKLKTELHNLPRYKVPISYLAGSVAVLFAGDA